MDKATVHRVNFYEPNPKAIHCLAYDKESSRLALTRSDFSIELWDIQHKPFLEKIIPGHSSFSVETIVWHKGRLFSAGLHGKIIEYDLLSLQHKYDCPISTGSSVWCLDVLGKKSLLAAGTENGYITLYSIEEENLDFEKTFSKQEGRILCLAWHNSGNIIVSGSIDAIGIWNVNTGQLSDRILVGRSEKRIETIIWCIAITSDMTIISGDSRGKTSFWDCKTGTLLCVDSSHKADVLALCLSKDENNLYSAGVDPTITMHVRTFTQTARESKGECKWVKSIQRRIHTHDVRALLMVDEYLISGGVDSNLAFSKYPPKTVFTFSPFSQISYCSVAPETSLLLLKYPQQLEIWKLGKTSSEPGTDGEILPLDVSPVKLLLINAKPHESILCSAISQNGKWIAYSTMDEIKLFLVEYNNSGDPPVLQKIKYLPENLSSTHCLIFTKSNKLVISNHDSSFTILQCAEDSGKLLQTFERNIENTLGTHLLAVSPNEEFLASGSHDGVVCIHRLETGELLCNLPRYKCQPTTMEFDASSENLIVVYCDRKVVEYHLESQAYSDWCRKSSHSTCVGLQECSFLPMRGIGYAPNNSDLLLLYDETAIYIVDKSSKAIEEPGKKRAKLKNASSYASKTSSKEDSFRTLKKYKYLLGLQQLNNGQLVVIEVQPCKIQDSLPAPLYQKKYGT